MESITFKTRSGNEYIYDNTTRLVIPKKSNQIGPSKGKSSVSYYTSKLHTIKNIMSEKFTNIRDVVEHHYREYNNRGISQLILIVTENCNMRCRYCAYSGSYTYNRRHRDNNMTFDVAKAAIDHYFERNMNSLRKNPFIKPSIGFYGGEPLLNWKLIVKSVEYIKNNFLDTFGDIQFTITTNGTLFKNNKIDYLLSNNFTIAVSLDGPQQEHDRNRVFKNGRPTFNIIIDNLNKLIERNSMLDKSGAPFTILITYDNNTSLLDIEYYFEQNKHIDSQIARIAKVHEKDTVYYKGQPTKLKLQQQMNILANKYFNILKNNEKPSHFLHILLNTAFTNLYFNEEFKVDYLCGTCFPGDKMAVDPLGNIHVCERINSNYPIGNVFEKGIEEHKQKIHLTTYLEMVHERCSSCNVSSLCKLCFALCDYDGTQFKIDKGLCENTKSSIMGNLSAFYSILEEHPDHIKEIMEKAGLHMP